MNKLTCTHCKKECSNGNIEIIEHGEAREKMGGIPPITHLVKTKTNKFCSYKCIGNWLKEREDDE